MRKPSLLFALSLASVLPVMAQAQQLRDEGVLTGDDDDTPVELDDDSQRLAQLFHAEEERRKAAQKARHDGQA